MVKLTFDEALERLADGRMVRALDVQARALSRMVWVAEWHLPGCLSESWLFGTTKSEAIKLACSMAEGEKGIPRGMVSALSAPGRFTRFDSDSPLFGRVINTVERRTLAEIIG